MGGEGHLDIGASDRAFIQLQEEAKVLKRDVSAPDADLQALSPRIVDLLDQLVSVTTSQREEIRSQGFDGRMTTLLTHYLAALTSLALAVTVVIGLDSLDHRTTGLILGGVVLLVAGLVHGQLVRKASRGGLPERGPGR